MEPRAITDADMALWDDRNPMATKFTAPGEMEAGIEPCPAVVLSGGEIAVPWTLSEIELVDLARGGQLWLVVAGGLPVHGLFVEPNRAGRSSERAGRTDRRPGSSTHGGVLAKASHVVTAPYLNDRPR